MNLNEILNKVELAPITKIEDRDVTGVFISDMLSDVMSSSQAGNLWVTVQTHKNIISAANLIDISAVIIAYGKKVPDETIELANRFHVNILSTSKSTYDLVKQLIEAGIE